MKGVLNSISANTSPKSCTLDLPVKGLSPSMASQRAEVAVCDTWHCTVVVA